MILWKRKCKASKLKGQKFNRFLPQNLQKRRDQSLKQGKLRESDFVFNVIGF